MAINKSFKELEIQDCVTLGYLYLVIIGIINVVIYYSSFNINIFDYIAITDILLAPINMLFLNYKVTAVILISTYILTYLLKFVFFGINKLIKCIEIKFNTRLNRFVYKPIIIFILLFSYILLDFTIDMTKGVNLRINNRTYRHNTTLTFSDNTQKDVYVFATTSIYLFYIQKGEEIVTITPISGNIKSIKDIKSK